MPLAVWFSVICFFEVEYLPLYILMLVVLSGMILARAILGTGITSNPQKKTKRNRVPFLDVRYC